MKPLNGTDLVTLIGSVGFPVVMCLYMITTLNKTIDNLDNRLLELSTKVITLLELSTKLVTLLESKVEE